MLPLLLASFLIYSASSQLQHVQVHTSRGQLIGYRFDLDDNSGSFLHGSGDVFLGIPFALPPIGDDRFKKPRPLFSYGIEPRNTTRFKPTCIQSTNDNIDISEDCLYLNVFTPKASQNSSYPVMVWIHGGSLSGGGASSFTPEGIIRNYVCRDVVVVTIQYRLGLLGFFTTHTDHIPPNLGMLDQVEALRWVRDQISFFGGDPRKSWRNESQCSFRLSALSTARSSLTHKDDHGPECTDEWNALWDSFVNTVIFTSPSQLCFDLFHAAIQHSGAVHTCFDGARSFLGNSQELARRLCNFTRSDWESGTQFDRLHTCLMGKHFQEWLPFEQTNMLGWRFVQDKRFLPDVPRNLASRRKRNLPVIIGSMRDEYASFLFGMIDGGMVQMQSIGRSFWKNQLRLLLGRRTEEQLATVQKVLEDNYAPEGTQERDWEEWMRIISDAVTGGGFISPIQEDIRDHLRNGNRDIYVYEMSRQSQLMRTSTIGEWKRQSTLVGTLNEVDTLYFHFAPFGTRFHHIHKNGSATYADTAILEWMAQTWTDFAKTGSPSSFWWKASNSEGAIPYLEIGDEKMAMKESYRPKDEYVWSVLVSQYLGVLPPQRPDFNNGSVYDEFYLSIT